MPPSLQFKSFNQIRIYIAMTSSLINQNSYGMIINLTFHLNHVGLIFYFPIVQGCISPWHSSTHIFHYIKLLDVMYSPHPLSLVRTIFVHVVSFTSPTLYGLLYSTSPPRNLSSWIHFVLSSFVDMLEIGF
jgi:hypothetical protein